MNTRTIILSKGNTKLTFDVNPKDVSVKEGRTSKVTDLLSGQHLYVGEKILREISIDTFIPSDNSPFRGNGMTISKAASQLGAWRDGVSTIQFSMTGLTTIECKIISVTKTVTEGDQDLWLSIELIEAKIPQKASADSSGGTGNNGGTGGLRNPPKGKAKTPSGTAASNKQNTYVVKSGDNLFNIAKKYYGNGSKWPTIYDKNKKVIGSNPNLLKPGQKLVIPAKAG